MDMRIFCRLWAYKESYWACKGYGLLFGGEAGWHIDRRGKCLAKTDRLSIGVLYGCDSEAGSRNKAVFIDRTG